MEVEEGNVNERWAYLMSSEGSGNVRRYEDLFGTGPGLRRGEDTIGLG